MKDRLKFLSTKYIICLRVRVMKLFKQLSKRLNKNSKKVSVQGMIKPIDVDFDLSKNEFLDNLSKHALKLYEKKCDVSNFTKLVLSDPENTSHNDLVNDLFKQNVKDPLENQKLAELADNEKFLRDLGLLD